MNLTLRGLVSVTDKIFTSLSRTWIRKDGLNGERMSGFPWLSHRTLAEVEETMGLQQVLFTQGLPPHLHRRLADLIHRAREANGPPDEIPDQVG